ncbi:MAG TPA: hypothetical protein VGQ41_14525 [Pyrinomonadaceae bacterium]|jgi:hypothetical protein|nr:hypothetical protein [Pyrinomonadaceae bacterium]
MQTIRFVVLLVLSASSYSCSRTSRITLLTPTASAQERRTVSATSAKVDFASQIEPLLKAKCKSCHFSGGKVYDKLPFDRPETIKTLGTKLFTRIHDENERKLIREFLSQE